MLNRLKKFIDRKYDELQNKPVEVIKLKVQDTRTGRVLKETVDIQVYDKEQTATVQKNLTPVYDPGLGRYIAPWEVFQEKGFNIRILGEDPKGGLIFKAWEIGEPEPTTREES